MTNLQLTRRRLAFLTRVLCALLLTAGLTAPVPIEAKDLGRVVRMQPPSTDNNDVLQGQVNASVKTTLPWSPLGFSYTLDNSKNFALKVMQVLPNSAAYKTGIKPGDKILDVKVSPTGTNLNVERQGKLYVASIKAPQSSGVGLQADQRLGKLAAHKLVVLIDQSGSMFEKDCPGGLSRWDWCERETMNVGGVLANRFGKDITVATFSNWFTLYPHCTIADIQHIFHVNEPRGDTQPQFAIKEVLTDYFKHNKSDQRPLMIAVVTDGVPSQPLDLAETIIDATKEMGYPGQVKVTFMQIADDPRAEQLLSAYDSDLMHDGARYDIVDYVEFKEVIKRGLLECLIASANGQLASTTQKRAYTGNLHRFEAGLQGLQGLPVYANPHSDDRRNVEDAILKKYSNR